MKTTKRGMAKEVDTNPTFPINTRYSSVIQSTH